MIMMCGERVSILAWISTNDRFEQTKDAEGMKALHVIQEGPEKKKNLEAAK
jgi:hypothetical protein